MAKLNFIESQHPRMLSYVECLKMHPKREGPGYRALFFCNLADGKSLPMHESRKNPYLR